jgi:hypothetical protein
MAAVTARVTGGEAAPAELVADLRERVARLVAACLGRDWPPCSSGMPPPRSNEVAGRLAPVPREVGPMTPGMPPTAVVEAAERAGPVAAGRGA